MSDKLEKFTAEDGKSLDLEAENIEQLRQIFPEVFRENKVDFNALKAVLGEHVEDNEERYNFTWFGKNKARRVAQTPSTGTLRPCSDKSIQWDATNNLFIEGDNLEVLKLLQKSYHQKVKMIYIDPPYNTGNEFIYSDNYKDSLKNYLELTRQVDEQGKAFSSNTESTGKYHTNWLNMMYPRLKLARNLLKSDGIIFISIDDTEVKNLRFICDEIFGEDNFLAQIAWEKRYTRSNNAKRFYSLKDNILAYRKSDELEYVKEARNEKSDSNYSNPDNDPRGPWTTSSYVNPAVKSERPNLVYSIKNPFTGEEVCHPTHAWKHGQETNKKHVEENRLWWGKDGTAQYPRLKLFLSEQDKGLVPIDLWDYKSSGTTDEGGLEIKELFGSAVFDTPKPTKLIQRMLGIATSPNSKDIVLDFFAGSSSTAHAVINQNMLDQGNRRFISVQLPEKCSPKSVGYKNGYKTISDISSDRIRKVIDKFSEKNSSENIDFGFKFFKLDETNFKIWDSESTDLSDLLDNSINNIKPSRTNLDILYEMILKFGLDLCTPVDVIKTENNTIFNVGFCSIIACFDEEYEQSMTELICKIYQDASPEHCMVVLRDSSFVNDSVKVNITQMLKQIGIQEIRSI